MKKAYLIHGWGGNPENCWFPWLKKNLENNGFEVFVPIMPGDDFPIKSVWIEILKNTIKNPNEDTYLIGHSLGCQAIQRYLENLPSAVKIGGSVFVAGWVNDPMWEGRTDEETEVVHDWYDTSKDYEKIKSHCKNFISIYSTDDPFIPEANWVESKEILDAEVIMIENKGHFDDEAGIKELPEALEFILKISNTNGFYKK